MYTQVHKCPLERQNHLLLRIAAPRLKLEPASKPPRWLGITPRVSESVSKNGAQQSTLVTDSLGDADTDAAGLGPALGTTILCPGYTLKSSGEL